MKRREEWRSILDAEIKRWEAKSCAQLISDLAGRVTTYERDFDSKTYQFEVQLLENTEAYVHVGIAVDDASLWGAIRPLSSSFIRNK
jgi:hypothetical protein